MENQNQIGDVVSGVVTSIQPYGAFLSFKDNGQGLLHISEISSRFIRNIENYFKVGQVLRVKIIAIDKKDNFYRLSIKQLNERERQFLRKPLTITKPKRTKIITNNKDFQILKDHLDEWIEKALREENLND